MPRVILKGFGGMHGVHGLLSTISQASETSAGDSLLRTDFEQWLEMTDKPTPAQERLFEVFLVSHDDENVSVYRLRTASWKPSLLYSHGNGRARSGAPDTIS